ncbi:MAG: hypothetical protein ACE5FL_04655 [Myxococcota bacterium]
MSLSEKTRARLVVLNIALWFVAGIASLSLLGGPRGAVATYLQPVQDELGGWFGLALAAAGVGEAPMPTYSLEIEPRVFRAAEVMGRAAQGNGTARDPWWFPARFGAEGHSYDVDLRFDRSARTGRPVLERSWRVRFRGDERYRGLREFDLTPATELRHAMNLVVRESARSLGLLAPPGGFATLRINGASAGPFFWSEGASNEMLERLGYPKGEILEPRIGASPASPLSGGANAIGLAHYEASIERDATDGPGADRLARLVALTGNAGDAQFHQVLPQILDIDKFLRWNALVAIAGDPVADGVHRLSWFFDPVTGLLEPVVSGIDRAAAVPAGLALETPWTSRLAERVLRQPAFRARHNEILWQMVSGQSFDVARESDARLGDVLTQLAKVTGSPTQLGALREAAEFRRDTRRGVAERAAALGSALAASQVDTTPHLEVAKGAPVLTLEVRPEGLARIELSELRFELGAAQLENRKPASIRLTDPTGGLRRSVSAEPRVIGSSVALLPKGLLLDADPGNESPWTVQIALPFLSADAWTRSGSFRAIDVVYRNAVTGTALPAAHLLDGEKLAQQQGDGLRALFRPVEDAIAASGLPLLLRGDEVVIPAGQHRLTRTLVVPPSHRLRIEAGATLSLDPGVSIIGFRRLRAEGTAAERIVLRASDPSRGWGTLAVSRAPETSKLSFVTVSGGSSVEFAGIEFDGQLSFNASDVVIQDSEIQDARDADGLSVKRARFEVVRTQFVTNESDGLDSEWSVGVVRESLFVNNGDDGLDLADSEVEVEASAFRWMGDKSISAGARSRVSIASTQLSDSDIAIASKEDSRVDVRDTEFRRNRLGFALYRDKPVFGGGSGTVTGGVFARNDRDFSVEPGSNLELIHVQREPAPAGDALIGALALRRVVTRSP